VSAAGKVVVTGGTGHLGRYVVHALGQAGWEVLAASRSGQLPRPPFGEELPPGVRALSCDIERDDSVELLARELGSEVSLVHLAAWHPPATARTTPDDRRRLLEANVLGTMRVLDAARQSGARAVSYASTFEVYGLPERAGAVVEDDRLSPISDYGATKLAGEDHLLAFGYEQKTRVVALRLPAIYGAGELTARALPNFLRQVAAGERPRIAGTGKDLRDQIHAFDAARAFVLALSSQANGIFNVADGAEHSILQLARMAMQLAGMSGEPSIEASGALAYHFHMSIERARADLGFAATVTLEQGMAQQLAWLRAGQPS
jgi:nucleoside-diphosphate-sugar epimerase